MPRIRQLAGKDRQHGGTGVNKVLRRFEAAIPHHGGFEAWPPYLLILFLAARNRRPRAGRVIPDIWRFLDGYGM